MALKVTSGVSKATAGLDVFESQVADMVEEVLGAYQDASEWSGEGSDVVCIFCRAVLHYIHVQA